MEDEPKDKSWKDKLEDLLFEDDGASATTSEPAADVAEDISKSPPSFGGVGDSSIVAMPSGEESLDLAAIYREAGIEDQQFATPEQVMELKSTFADLPAEVQRQKVLKTLGSFKVDVSRVAFNTQRKIAAVEEYVSGVRTSGAATIDTSNQTIEELQRQIDECKKRIMETQTLLDKVSREGQAAVTKLRAVLDFLGVVPASAETIPPAKGKSTKPGR